MKRIYPIKRFAFVAIALAALFFSGCAARQHDRIAAFGTGVTAAKEQTQIAFASVTELTDEALVDYAAKQQTLKEENLLPVLEPDAVAKWQRAFSDIENYALKLAILTSPKLAQAFTESMEGLGGQIKSKTSESFPSGLFASFIKLGDVLLRIKGQRAAEKVIVQTDPAIREIFVTMADVIGSDHLHGVRRTAYSNWTLRLGTFTTEFGKMEDLEERREIVRKFAAMMKIRDNQDFAFVSLRRSFLALADAHSALSKRDDSNFGTAIAVVLEELKDLKEIHKRLKEK